MAKEKPVVECEYGTEDAAEIVMRSFAMFMRRELEQACGRGASAQRRP